MAAIAEAVVDHCDVLVVVPTIELQRQWIGEITRLLPGVQVGALGDGSKASMLHHQVVVGVVNSAAMNRESLLPGDRSLLVADECHRYATASFSRVLDDAFSRRLGITATYSRDDGAHRSIWISTSAGSSIRCGMTELFVMA